MPPDHSPALRAARLRILWTGAAAVALSIGVFAIWASYRVSLRTARLDFESGDFSGWTRKLAASHSGLIVRQPVRRGVYAARFELRAGDDTGDGVRAELKERFTAPFGRDVWYSFSTWIPPDFPIVPENTVITQWHAQDDAGEEAASRSPVLAHRYEAGALVIDARSSAVPTQSANDGTRAVLFRQPDLPRGVWHDFVYRIRWSWREDGQVEAWLNGKRIIYYRGPAGYNDRAGPYFKFGLYKHAGSRPFVIFHDEYRRGFSRSEVEGPAR
jgi:hypothetical protein